MKESPDVGEESYRRHARLTDKVALTTGADSGIGQAVALVFAREGADVVIGYLNEEGDARETQRLVESAGRRARLVPGDLADETQCRQFTEKAVKKLGRIDGLVNNAAYQDKAVEQFEELSFERVERAFRVDILAMFHLVCYALPHLAEGSSIINVASIQAYQPTPSILDYASTKGAIVTFTKDLAQDLIKRGIRVNSVASGPVWTPLIVQSFDQKKIDSFGENSPVTRPAQPAELAPAFVFLASEEASYINGEILGVTGGKPLG